MKSLREHFDQVERDGISPSRGDAFAIEIGEECLIESYIVDVVEDGVVIHADDRTMALLEESGCTMERIARYGAVGKNRAMGFSYAESVDEDKHCAECGYAMEACECNEDALAYPQLGEDGMSDGDEAHRKIQTPAYLRKAHGARDPDWKVSLSDLEKAKERTATSPEGLAARKRELGISETHRMLELAGIRQEDDSHLAAKTLELSPTGPAADEINEDDDSVEGIENAIIRRIMLTHIDALSKHGPRAVMAAARDRAEEIGSVDEIGTSDVSIWTREVLRNLESGEYDHVNEDPTTEEPLPTQEPESDQPTNIENPQPGAVAARAFDEAMMSEDDVEEAKYRGREVKLGKPMTGDIKKKKVYVRKPNGNIVKVEFGDKKMRIKKHIPARRKSFRARHHCENPGPRWKARYWSCRAW